MPAFGPIKRSELIFYLRKLGFSGPHGGGRHQFMQKGDIRVILPNPHRGDISTRLLNRLLKQAGISREAWERL